MALLGSYINFHVYHNHGIVIATVQWPGINWSTIVCNDVLCFNINCSACTIVNSLSHELPKGKVILYYQIKLCGIKMFFGLGLKLGRCSTVYWESFNTLANSHTEQTSLHSSASSLACPDRVFPFFCYHK